MNRFKKAALLLLAMPVIGYSAGMGIYIPSNITENEKIEYDDTFAGTYDHEYKPSAGFGVAFDTNIGKNRLFNYRLGLEYSHAELDNLDGESVPSGTEYTKDKFNIVNTFGFGVLRKQHVRLWVGPRLNIQFESGEFSGGSTTFWTQDSFGIGLGVAAGVNVNLGRLVTLAADLDYHAVAIYGTEENALYSVGYSGVNEGVTARLYLLFRFRERF
jgi:hypothetical protein